jgi:hypothetical protein
LHHGVIAILAPGHVLIEDGVARHMNLAISRIVQLVCLALRFVADKDHIESPALLLVEGRPRDLHVRNAAEHPKMMHQGLLAMPSLVRCLALDVACWRMVLDVYNHHDCFSPKSPQHANGPQR